MHYNYSITRDLYATWMPLLKKALSEKLSYYNIEKYNELLDKCALVAQFMNISADAPKDLVKNFKDSLYTLEYKIIVEQNKYAA